MDLRDPESMNDAISEVLRYGVLLSAAVTLLGTALLAVDLGTSGTGPLLTYDQSRLPHGTFPVSLGALLGGLATAQPYSIIELGVILLIATPVSRVTISVFLFAAERDRTYVYITLVVLALLLFSILVTPFIPGFNA